MTERVDSVKINTLPQNGVQAEPKTKQQEAILTLKLKENSGTYVEHGMSKEQVAGKLEELRITTVEPDFIKDIKTAEDGEYVTFEYKDGSVLTIKRNNNTKDVKASMEVSDGKFQFNLQGNNAVFTAGFSVQNVNVDVMSSNLTIDTSNSTATNINLPSSGISNITIIPDKDLKKDTITQDVGFFKGDSGFLWHNKTAEISEKTTINPR